MIDREALRGAIQARRDLAQAQIGQGLATFVSAWVAVEKKHPRGVFLLQNSPVRIVSDCERDLRMLDRHHLYVTATVDGVELLSCVSCRGIGQYGILLKGDCVEIQDLASSYELLLV